MKKVLRFYLIILFVIFIVFSFLDRKGLYNLEKKIWKLQKDYFELAKDPLTVSDRTFNDLIEKIEVLVKDNPDSDLIREVMILVGRIYELKKDFDAARLEYEHIFNKYKEDDNLSAEVRFLIGKTYEKEGDWEKAELVYRNVSLDYMLTPVGLDVPMYITRYYRKINNYKETLDAYSEAIAHYKIIIAAQPDSLVDLSAMRLLSKCYFEQQRWQESVETLGEILMKYGSSSYLSLKDADVLIKTINVIATFKMKDTDIAVELYQEIIAQNPKSPLGKYLQLMVDGFEQYKEQNDQQFIEQ